MLGPDAVSHTCNPSNLGGQGRQIIQGQEFKTSLANMVKPISTKYTKKNQPNMVVHACSPSYLWGWGRRIAWTRKTEVVMSRDRTTALQPCQQEWNSVSKKKKRKKKVWAQRKVNRWKRFWRKSSSRIQCQHMVLDCLYSIWFSFHNPHMSWFKQNKVEVKERIWRGMCYLCVKSPIILGP